MKKIFYLFVILLSCQPDAVETNKATGTDFIHPVRANGGLAITAPLSLGGVTITATGAEINFLSGVTSNIQTQLNGKASTSHTQAQSTITGLADSLLNHYTKAQVNTRLNLKVNISDTASMLAHYALLSETGTGDLSASDTSAMLTPYINRSDTATMLGPYVRINDSVNVTSIVLFHVGDTNVTAALGRVVYKTSNNHFYGCISTTATSTPKWKQMDN